jgi:integrase
LETAVRAKTTKITRQTINAAWQRRAPKAREIIPDSVCGGLSLVVGTRGMSWVLEWKPRGTNPESSKRWATQKLVIGTPETHGPEAARDAATKLKMHARAGYDPAVERRDRIAAASERRARTAGGALERYERELPRRAKMRGGSGIICAAHAEQEARHVRKALALMGAADKPITEISVTDVARMVAHLAEHPAGAWHAYGALTRFLDWCCEHGWMSVNVCAALPKSKRPRPPQARAHYLRLEQLTALWRAADALRESVWRDLARFLIAVPCRRGEAARLDWSHLDLAQGEWRQPGKLTKNREPHRLHLHPLVLSLLRERHVAAGRPQTGLVFPAPESRKAVDTFSDIKEVLSEVAKLPDWIWHDFRRSFATALGEAGISEPVVDAVLNHRQSASRGGVLGVYQRASRWPEQRRAMEIWGRMLAAAIDGDMGDSNVIALAAAAG